MEQIGQVDVQRHTVDGGHHLLRVGGVEDRHVSCHEALDRVEREPVHIEIESPPPEFLAHAHPPMPAEPVIAHIVPAPHEQPQNQRDNRDFPEILHP